MTLLYYKEREKRKGNKIKGKKKGWLVVIIRQGESKRARDIEQLVPEDN